MEGVLSGQGGGGALLTMGNVSQMKGLVHSVLGIATVMSISYVCACVGGVEVGADLVGGGFRVHWRGVRQVDTVTHRAVIVYGGNQDPLA